MIAEFFPWWREKPFEDIEPSQERSGGRRRVIVEVRQSRDAFVNVNTDRLPQDANHWEHARTERPD